MRPALILLLLATPALAQPEPEDAAHRADRLEVQRLNSRSPNGYVAPRHGGAGSDAGQRAYAKAQADYQDRLDAWRRRVAACEAGQYEACQ
jgi:hypothetical protein